MPVVRPYSESTALIVGGTSGIGLASARALAHAGVPQILLVGRDQQRGETAVASVKEAYPLVDVEFASADATRPDDVERAVAHAVERFGSLTIAVCATAADHNPELLIQIEASKLGRIASDLLVPPMLVCRAALPAMKEQGGGSIIIVASDAAKVATPGETVIGAAMAGIVMFTKAAALEAKRDGIRINTVTPSLVSGTMTTARITDDGFSKRLFAKAAQLAHLGVPEPDDVGALIAFLAGPSAGRMTGQAVSVNGGISVG
ncbi:2-hydroxycyclohexanecarboxyl-CoA dehydrogenase [Rhodococcus opacus PD630]|uniref:SDR family NAD(P)-dependent oxidoreductase n=1 Tax=Rhodococcus opacus TaxID=37919 RepID=UPI00029CD1C2|nr:SDR family oxidoreductase [Rhodococcus opacus]AHK36054.1 Dehydrogenase/reductase SDR family member 4 [Rhodococcus opacus PD630]EHI43574.1 2-hydroxycyclohexanecarboxyl-CoA dehydrogenase [Rhodococcus opacus PD630]UDH01292.1 SDR family oxidoreductase [Rhodococcus opacus PD630]